MKTNKVTVFTNAAKCLGCNDIIVSKHRHDFVGCSCGNLHVDGGNDYSKRGFGSKPWVNLKSVSVDADGKIVEVGEEVNPFPNTDNQ